MKTPIKGRLLAFTALILVAWTLATLARLGVSEEAIRGLVRVTAKLALTLLCLAFSASSLHSLLGRNWTRVLVRNRREIGLSFALTHFVHLLALIALGIFHPSPFLGDLEPIALIGGGFAYLLILALAITSTDRAQRRLGRRWHTLHLLSCWYILIVFTQSYVPRALSDLIYLPFVFLIAATISLRSMRWVKKRRRGDSAPQPVTS